MFLWEGGPEAEPGHRQAHSHGHQRGSSSLFSEAGGGLGGGPVNRCLKVKWSELLKTTTSGHGFPTRKPRDCPGPGPNGTVTVRRAITVTGPGSQAQLGMLGEPVKLSLYYLKWTTLKSGTRTETQLLLR
jgi:hypothetical protein